MAPTFPIQPSEPALLRPYVLGVDIASPQGMTVNHARNRKEGILFTIAKATQGAFSTDHTFVWNITEIAKVFEFGGAYLWIEPQHDPFKQAQRFADVAGTALDKISNPIVMIDFEDDDRDRPGGPVRGERLVSCAETVASEILRMLRIEPLLYSGKYFLLEAVGKTPMPLLSKLPYCHAQYPRPICPGGKTSVEYTKTVRALRDPNLPVQFPHADFRQFDGTGGLVLPQGTDSDFMMFDGSVSDLRVWCRKRQLKQLAPDGALRLADTDRAPATSIADEVNRATRGVPHSDTIPGTPAAKTSESQRLAKISDEQLKGSKS